MDELVQMILCYEDYKATSYYVYHLRRDLYRYFDGCNWKGVPQYLRKITDFTRELINRLGVKPQDIIHFLATDNCYFLVANTLILYFGNGAYNVFQRDEIVNNETSWPEDLCISDEALACVVASYVLDNYGYSSWNLKEIVAEERFAYDITDYKLTRVEDVDFCQRGFIFDGKYYLYSVFLNIEALLPNEPIPAIFKIIKEEIDSNAADLLLRLDERLAIAGDRRVAEHREQFQQYYGPAFRFSETKIRNVKNITVHFNPGTLDKLLMVVKKDTDLDLHEEMWHVEVETIPNISEGYQCSSVFTSFVHGKYYPARHKFRHVDFAINGYETEVYRRKYSECKEPEVRIDYHTETKDEHYKIWCIENNDFEEGFWLKLVMLSLAPKYRELFDEIIEQANSLD